MTSTVRGNTYIAFLIYAVFFVALFVVVQHFFNITGQFNAHKDSQRVQDLLTLQHAIDNYYETQGRYPASDSSFHIISLTNKQVSWGGSWSPYLKQIPQDPDGSKNYVYIASPDRQAYYLYTSLDTPEANAASCKGKCLNAPPSACGTTATCNFGITSPNVSP